MVSSVLVLWADWIPAGNWGSLPQTGVWQCIIHPMAACWKCGIWPWMGITKKWAGSASPTCPIWYVRKQHYNTNKSLNPFHTTFQKVLNPSFSTIPLLLRQHKSLYLFASHCIDCHCFVTKLSLPQISLYSQNASLMIEWNQRIMGNKFQAVHPCPHLHHPKQFCYFFVIFVNIIIWCIQFFTFCNPNSLWDFLSGMHLWQRFVIRLYTDGYLILIFIIVIVSHFSLT